MHYFGINNITMVNSVVTSHNAVLYVAYYEVVLFLKTKPHVTRCCKCSLIHICIITKLNFGLRIDLARSVPLQN